MKNYIVYIKSDEEYEHCPQTCLVEAKSKKDVEKKITPYVEYLNENSYAKYSFDKEEVFSLSEMKKYPIGDGEFKGIYEINRMSCE